MKKTAYPGQIIIIAAPSGAGKTSLVNALLEKIPGLKLSISHTTRTQRPNEKDGEHYWFIDEKTFLEKIKHDEFLEYAQVFDHYYGTSKQWLLEQLQKGFDIILEIDWQGAQIIRQHYPDALSIFILPPSFEALRERLYKRKQDPEKTIERRLKEANFEMQHYAEFDYLIVNDNFDHALQELSCIISADRSHTPRQTWLHQKLLNELLKVS